MRRAFGTVAGSSVVRFVRWAAAVAASSAVSLILVDIPLAGFAMQGAAGLTLGFLVLNVLPALLWPFTYRVASILHPLVFPVLTFLLTAVAVVLVVAGVRFTGLDAVRIDDLRTALVLVFLLPLVGIVVATIFSLNDDNGYEWFVDRPLRRQLAGTPRDDQPGILFLEIDGLAEPVLREAIATGRLPTLARWLATGTHTITPWETDFSSQTGASQAGLLMGDNAGIPAFRWWDRERGRLVRTSSGSDVRELERALASGDGLLVDGGASRWNVFSGEATDSIATYSTFGQRRHSTEVSYLAVFTNVFLLSRTLGLYMADVGREWGEAIRQRVRDIRPRIHRPLRYAFVRAATTTFMQEASRFMLLADVYRGVPAVYTTFFGYDEVAHHSGVTSRDAFRVLERMDRVFASLERAMTHAPRPYHLVVLSDHGQSNGSTFRQRFGLTLRDVVDGLIAAGTNVYAQLDVEEGQHHVQMAVSDALHDNARLAPVVRRFLRTRTDASVSGGDWGTPAEQTASSRAASSDIVVLASGNLGLISFPGARNHPALEQIVRLHPRLIDGLCAHPGVSFVVVRSEMEGWLVIGQAGIVRLDDGQTTGESPLAGFGPNTLAHLRREVSFANVPDILVLSMVDHGTGEVAAFEELVGSHGGIGGPQSEAFVLHPVACDPGPEPIVGAVAMHRVLKRWRQGAAPPGDVLAERPVPDPVQPAVSAVVVAGE